MDCALVWNNETFEEVKDPIEENDVDGPSGTGCIWESSSSEMTIISVLSGGTTAFCFPLELLEGVLSGVATILLVGGRKKSSNVAERIEPVLPFSLSFWRFFGGCMKKKKYILVESRSGQRWNGCRGRGRVG